jgi:hypothetical protein
MRLFLTIGGPWLTDGPRPEVNNERASDPLQSHGVRRPDGSVVVTHYDDGTERVAHYDADGNLLRTEERRSKQG